jgi:hypothetical protein
MMSTAMAAMINSRAILTNTAETCRRRGRPYRTLVSGSHVSVGSSRNSKYKKNITRLNRETWEVLVGGRSSMQGEVGEK